MLPPKQVQNQKPEVATENNPKVISPGHMFIRDILVRSIYFHAKQIWDDGKTRTLSSACAQVVSKIKNSDAPSDFKAVILALLKLEYQGNA